MGALERSPLPALKFLDVFGGMNGWCSLNYDVFLNTMARTDALGHGVFGCLQHLVQLTARFSAPFRRDYRKSRPEFPIFIAILGLVGLRRRRSSAMSNKNLLTSMPTTCALPKHGYDLEGGFAGQRTVPCPVATEVQDGGFVVGDGGPGPRDGEEIHRLMEIERNTWQPNYKSDVL